MTPEQHAWVGAVGRDDALGGSTQSRNARVTTNRKLAAILAADVVDHQLSEYLEKHGIAQQFGAQERILVYITPRANADEMIQTARTMADRFHAEMIVAYMRQPELSLEDKNALEDKLASAEAAGAKLEILEGEDPVESILELARSRGITQLFIGHAQTMRKWPWTHPVDRLIRRSRSMDVRIFPQ